MTTLFPDSSALRTQFPAGSSPPANSTIMSTSEANTASASSDHATLAGAQSTRLRATFLLKTCVSSSPSGLDSNRIRATELPTVPKPKKAMRNGLPMRGEGAESSCCTA